jgi:DNA-binding NtrC family response regulator
MGHARRPVVLVVDDDEGMRDALGVTLESDYDAVTASGGRAALQIFRQRSVDGVLLDIRMPDIDGLAVLRQMRAIDPRMGIVLVSAVDETPTIVQAIKSGAVDYLTKPFLAEDLLAALAKAARRRFGVEDILLVAREIGVLTALEVILDQTMAATICLSPVAVLNHPAGRRPRLVVVDDRRSRRDGTEPVRALRIRYSGCPILTVCEPGDVHRVFEQVTVTMASFADMPVAKPHVRPVVLAAAQHVAGHYREKLRTRDVAERVGVSADQLGQAFEESLHLGVKEFVTRFRISAACHLLAGGDFKLEHIAELTGFDDASHLSRVFVQQRGVRPGEYRRQLDVA